MGCLLLTFGLLTMLAPPGESHELGTDTNGRRHALPSLGIIIPSDSAHGHVHDLSITKFFGGDLTAIHPKHFEIEWIRVYKNPKTTKLADLTVDRGVFAGVNAADPVWNHIILPPGFEVDNPNGPGRRARLYPSLWREYKAILDGDVTLDKVDDDYFWVDIHPTTGELIEDPEQRDNSGLVTDSENTTVAPGDIVAIAINVKLHDYRARKELAVGMNPQNADGERTGNILASHGRGSTSFLPLAHVPVVGEIWARDFNDGRLENIAGGSITAAVGIPHVGILNPNYALERLPRLLPGDRTNFQFVDTAISAAELGHGGRLGYHTIVYQFEVTDAHLALNNLPGGWIDGDGTNVNPFNVPYSADSQNRYEDADFDTDRYPSGLPYTAIETLRESTSADHNPEFGFAVPFSADTNLSGKRWNLFHDASALIAGAPYSAYPDSPDDAFDDDPGHAGSAEITGSAGAYTAGQGRQGGILKKWQYRHRTSSYSDAEANFMRSAGRTTKDLDGVYHRGEGTWPFEIKRTDLDRNGDNLLDYLPVIDLRLSAPAVGGEPESNGRVQHYTVSPGFYRQDVAKLPHLYPPTYDTTKGPIYYPTVELDIQRVTPEIVDVPTETQTGDPFQVTLSFARSDKNLTLRAVALAYDESDAFLASLQAALTSAFEHATVTQVERLEPRDTEDKSVRYQVTVVPSVLGVIGEMTLRVPADTVVDMASELGNAASAAVTVPIDTRLALTKAPDIVVPEEGYTTGSQIEVAVTYARENLRYEGDDPPYLTLYLGEKDVSANARHAIWARAEAANSTKVTFTYTVAAEDRADSVRVAPVGLTVPQGTTVLDDSPQQLVGTSDPAKGSGEGLETLPPAGEGQLQLGDSDTELSPRTDVPINPIYFIPEASDPKSVASTVPRSPIVFNELGNGSDATNDWLELRNVSGSDVSLKDWELSVVADGKKEDTSLIVFPDVSVPANGLLLIANMPSDKTPLAGGQNKGLSHASLVEAGLSLPDDGKFLLILRNAKEKLGLDEAFIDVAGGGGSDTDAFIRDATGDYDTHVWPLQVLEAPGDATEDALSSGKVWQRAKADIIGYHQDAWAEAAFTGIGYDRKVTQSAATAGTPGYPNGALKTEAATPKGAVTISEIMFDSEGGTLPQWIELYNKSKTEALNLNRWQLEIQNRNSRDLIGRPIVTLTLQEKVIQPNQTLLIVAGDARASSADVFPEDRVYNLFKLHEKNLRIKTPRDTFLSGEGFYLKLSDRNGTKIDEVGNIDDNRRTDDAPVWVWPTNLLGRARSSVVRRYDKGTAVARDGMVKSSWALAGNFNQFKVESLHYGHADDIGTPGYRKGGALPVELSSFTVSRTDEGPVVITWTTESEVDNAGFNLRRSERRDSGFTLLNPTLIAGAGTTGERQTYTFTDTSAKPGIEYYYQIEEISLDGRPETLRTRRLPGPVSPANRSLTTFGEVKQRE